MREASTSSKSLGSVTVVPYLFSPTHTSKPDNPENRSPPTSPPWRAMRGAIRAEKRERKEKEKEGSLPHPLTRGRWGVSGMILVFCFAQAGQ